MVNYNEIKDKSDSELIAIAQKYMQIEDWTNATIVLSHLIDENPYHEHALFMMGKVFSKVERKGIANIIYRRALQLNPMKAELWGAVGHTIDAYLEPEEAFKYLKKANQMKPKHETTLVNMANALGLDGQWEESLKWATEAMEVSPNSAASHDNYGMAKLALGEWAEGWDNVEWALGHGYRPETQYKDEGRWTGKKGQKVICYGMQGIGDEILYGSCIPDLIEDCEEVIVDCDRRLQTLFRRSFPQAHVYGTRKCPAEWPNHHEWDARVAIDTLPRFYRRSWDDFPGKPFLKADPDKVFQWKALLDKHSGRPKIGIAWMGGGKLTARKRRSIDVELLKPLQEIGDLVDLSHEKNDHKGMDILQWDHATMTADYDDTAGLVAALDYVVTVPTSIVHLAGGLGIPTYVLKPDKPSWRYNPDRMPWYDAVELIPYESWERSIQSAKEKIQCSISSSGTIKSKASPTIRSAKAS